MAAPRRAPWVSLMRTATLVILPLTRWVPSTASGRRLRLTDEVCVCRLTVVKVKAGGPGWPIVPPMPPRSHIAPRTGIGLLHFARREDLLVLNDHDPHAVTAAGVGPDA